MAALQAQTIAKPVSNLVGTLKLRTDRELIDAHSAHTQHSGNSQAEREFRERPVQTPENWPTTRGVPEYRPLNPHQDFASRPFGQNGPEQVFVTLMLGGVWVQGVIRTGWKWLGSPGHKYLKYDVGGMF